MTSNRDTFRSLNADARSALRMLREWELRYAVEAGPTFQTLKLLRTATTLLNSNYEPGWVSKVIEAAAARLSFDIEQRMYVPDEPDTGGRRASLLLTDEQGEDLLRAYSDDPVSHGRYGRAFALWRLTLSGEEIEKLKNIDLDGVRTIIRYLLKKKEEREQEQELIMAGFDDIDENRS